MDEEKDFDDGPSIENGEEVSDSDEKKKDDDDEKDEEEETQVYNLWEHADVELDTKQRFKLRNYIPKTKVPPPGTAPGQPES